MTRPKYIGNSAAYTLFARKGASYGAAVIFRSTPKFIGGSNEKALPIILLAASAYSVNASAQCRASNACDGYGNNMQVNGRWQNVCR